MNIDVIVHPSWFTQQSRIYRNGSFYQFTFNGSGWRVCRTKSDVTLATGSA